MTNLKLSSVTPLSNKLNNGFVDCITVGSIVSFLTLTDISEICIVVVTVTVIVTGLRITVIDYISSFRERPRVEYIAMIFTR